MVSSKFVSLGFFFLSIFTPALALYEYSARTEGFPLSVGLRPDKDKKTLYAYPVEVKGNALETPQLSGMWELGGCRRKPVWVYTASGSKFNDLYLNSLLMRYRG
jgi:hypothetical protein